MQADRICVLQGCMEGYDREGLHRPERNQSLDGGSESCLRFSVLQKQTVKKVPTGRHARTVGTHTGKFDAESVRARQGECAVQRQILSPGTAKLRRVLRTKQPKRSRGSGLPFASPLRRAQQKQGTATTRGKEFLSRVCGQKWVPPGACRFLTR